MSIEFKSGSNLCEFVFVINVVVFVSHDAVVYFDVLLMECNRRKWSMTETTEKLKLVHYEDIIRLI
jgi:hypothetical protein